MSKTTSPTKSNKKKGYLCLAGSIPLAILAAADSYLPNDNGGTNMWLGFFGILFMLPAALGLVGLGIWYLHEVE